VVLAIASSPTDPSSVPHLSDDDANKANVIKAGVIHKHVRTAPGLPNRSVKYYAVLTRDSLAIYPNSKDRLTPVGTIIRVQ
jgi:uncharacterized protein (DUF849 family)